MPVPDNNTFSLQDVVNEVNPTTNDLQDCVNDANSASYDTNYYTSPATSLKEFRNYGAVPLKNIVLSNGVIDSNRCNGTILINYVSGGKYWIETNQTHPGFIIGDTIYTDSSLSQTFNGQNLWYVIGSLDTMSHQVIRRKISTSGVITEEFTCP